MDPQAVAAIINAVHELAGIKPQLGAKHFVYESVVNFADAAAIGTSQQTTINTVADSDFVCTALRVSLRVDDTGRAASADDNDGASELGGLPDPAVLIQVEEGSGDRLWHSQAVDALAVYGPLSPNQGRLARPKLIPANSTLTITLTLLKQAAAGTGFDVRASFIGYKLYPRPIGV